METTPVQAKPSVDVDTNYLKLGTKLFAVKEILGQGIDIDAETKEFYKSKYEQHTEQFGNALADNMTSEWTTQANRIREYSNQQQVVIPPNLFDKLVMYRGNMLLEMRTVHYEPKEVTVVCSTLRYYSGMQASPLLRDFADGDNLIATIIPPCSIDILVGYNARHNRIFTPFSKTIHSFNDGRVCTGNASANVYWELSDNQLGVELSKINLFSPASSVIVHNGITWNRTSFITGETVIAVRRREGGESSWNRS